MIKKMVIGLGGSSGSIYAYRLLVKLQSVSNVETHVVWSKNAQINWDLELPGIDIETLCTKTYNNDDFFAPFASGSAKFESMVIIPSSMALLGRLAQGVSTDLIGRAADVMLKERRRLIVVPRECPYNAIHLRNMLALTEAGGIVCPASPSFYSKPITVTEVVDTVVDRVIDLLGIEIDSPRWGDESIVNF